MAPTRGVLRLKKHALVCLVAVLLSACSAASPEAVSNTLRETPVAGDPSASPSAAKRGLPYGPTDVSISDVREAGPPPELAAAARVISRCDLAWDVENTDFNVERNGKTYWTCPAAEKRGIEYVAASKPLVTRSSYTSHGGISLNGDSWVIGSQVEPSKKVIGLFTKAQKAVGGELKSSVIRMDDKSAIRMDDRLRDTYSTPPRVDAYSSTSGVEYRWLPSSQFECRSAGVTCFGMMVRPELSCPRGVYVEVNLLNRAGTVVDWTNDSVPALAAGEKAKLIFETYNDDVAKARVAHASCHRE